MIQNFDVNLIALIISLCAALTQIYFLKKESNKNNLHHQFIRFNGMIAILVFGLLLQIIMSKTSIPPIYFEYISYTGAMFIPTTYLIMSVIYWKKDANVAKLDWIYILPLVSLFLLWTNDVHHLFYIRYSIMFSETIYGPALILYAIYSYVILVISMLIISISSIKRSGLFSLQAIIIVVAAIIPLLGNIFGFFNIAQTTVYTTPILFSIMSVMLYIAIFKLKALNIIPVSLRTIVDSMSDSYVVISDDGTIVDMNETFVDKFSYFHIATNNDNLFDVVEKTKIFNLKQLQKSIKESRFKKKTITREMHIIKENFDKFFEIDIQPIASRDKTEFVATLILIRDVTTAKRDMEILVKNENLVILGELAGGVAHDINTPISAIKSGILMLKGSSKNEDEVMLLSSMDSCADKIIALTNSLRNQIRNTGSTVDSDVNISLILADIKLILNNELKKRKVNLNMIIDEEIHLMGNPTKLSQVLTNIITNAMQAYAENGGDIEVKVQRNADKQTVQIAIEDWAGGIPESVRPYIFKNILTTKGVSGTGFGLYLAYSIVKGAFGGDISFNTLTGKGTRFVIVLPLKTKIKEEVQQKSAKGKKKKTAKVTNE